MLVGNRRQPIALIAVCYWQPKIVTIVLLYVIRWLHGAQDRSGRGVARGPLLRRILPKDNTGRIRFTDHIVGSGEALFKKVEALNLEGVVMKRKASVYSSLPSRDWLKVRTSAGHTTIQKRIETWG